MPRLASASRDASSLAFMLCILAALATFKAIDLTSERRYERHAESNKARSDYNGRRASTARSKSQSQSRSEKRGRKADTHRYEIDEYEGDAPPQYHPGYAYSSQHQHQQRYPSIDYGNVNGNVYPAPTTDAGADRSSAYMPPPTSHVGGWGGFNDDDVTLVDHYQQTRGAAGPRDQSLVRYQPPPNKVEKGGPEVTWADKEHDDARRYSRDLSYATEFGADYENARRRRRSRHQV